MKADPSDVLILAGAVGVAAFAGHFAGPWFVLLAVALVVLAVGIIAAVRGN